MALNPSDPTALRGAAVRGHEDVELGLVHDVYLDDETGQAAWAAVRPGPDGPDALVPLAAADYRDGVLRLPYTRGQLRGAPHHEPGTAVSVGEQERLRAHFDASGAGDTGADAAMTRSEEELHVGTRTVATGRVRVRKHVVTEMRTITVPVSHEELSVEHEEIPEADRDGAADAPDLSLREHEMILRAEQPVVTTQVVATERVRIATRIVHEQQQVTAPVRREQIDVDPPDTAAEQR